MTEPECAKYCGISDITLKRMRRAGKVEYVQLTDRRIGYRLSQADKIIADRTVPATTIA